MLPMLLRPFRGRGAERERDADQDLREARHDGSRSRPPSTVPEYYRQHRHATADFTEADDDDDDDESNPGPQQRFRAGSRSRSEHGEDGPSQSGGVLPIFATNHLDLLPIYSLTHAIRIIVQTRTETALTWDQLRSPQVFQFLVKPMQQQIRTQHFSRGTIYALMVNCLQFQKEAQLYPGNAGTSSTRAKVCELLAIKLLKEYTTRELIDALSYDFYPLQGHPGSVTPLGPGGKGKPAALRTSTLEVAIRASTKHFLSHPLVVQQVEAIWNGAISFYSVSDQLHRQSSVSTAFERGQSRRQSDARTPLLETQQAKDEQARLQLSAPGRRNVNLYDPRNASLFKLSRLRVPRYRQILSTCSLAVLICLFLAVLSQRSHKITTLELVFWFWSAGFMLDELVGFSEQGFSLYIMSFWNIFDLGILVLLIVYYCMRIWGVFLLDPHKWNEMAYDVLAANAILLLPRIFTVLDHYQYFSQLLIAFRLLAIDMAAVFMLLFVSCSGFLVFFIFSKSTQDPSEIAFQIFQILLGYTPAAWEAWGEYTWLGKALMGLFLIICHFVIITILITVLTNSYMSILSNAQQEHQFLFAINTISMVKNDALFSYIAPGNIFAWACMPLRYFMPMKLFVWVNRTLIKITHFPILFCIYIYEKYILAPTIYEPTDLVENRDRSRHQSFSFADPTNRNALFSPSVRVREESVVGYQKDRALDEVFRRLPDMSMLRTQRRNERRKTQNAIRSWMDQHDGGIGSPPRNYSTIDGRLASEWQQRRMSMTPKETKPRRHPQHLFDTRSAASDPADLVSNAPYTRGTDFYDDGVARRDYARERKESTDADIDGDDELVTNDEDEEDTTMQNAGRQGMSSSQVIEEDYFTTPMTARFNAVDYSFGDDFHQKFTASPRPQTSRRIGHHRTLSTNTILYAPSDDPQTKSSSSTSAGPSQHTRSRPLSTKHTPTATPNSGRRSPRRSAHIAPPSRLRQTPPQRDIIRTLPNRVSLVLDIPTSQAPSSLRSSIELHEPVEMGEVMPGNETFGPVAGTATSLAKSPLSDGSNRVNRLVVERMKTLEQTLGSMAREMRILRSTVPSTSNSSGDDGTGRRLSKRLTAGSMSGSAGTASPGTAAMERERKGGRRARISDAKPETPNRRLMKRRSSTKEWIGPPGKEPEDKGKGKGVAQSSDEDSQEEEYVTPMRE